jgi:hypothetical protein
LLAEIDVNFLNSTLFGFPVLGIVALLALVLGVVLLKALWPKKKSGKRSHVKSVSPDGTVKDFMSTMRLSDTQRIDRLHRLVTLSTGEKADLKDLSFDRLTKLAVTFRGIEQARGQDFARIKLELGGASADCGISVKEVGDNDFLVPRAAPDDPRCVIHYMSGKGDAVSFLQVKVQKIDPVKGSAAIDVLHLRGRQAA